MAIDFTGLTDLINATMTILATFNNNSSTLVGFIVLMAELGLVGIIIYGFVAVFLRKMAGKIGGSGKENR